ncbi:MAG: hypothetical protein WCH85_05210 [Methanomicrobiales archaeon]
MEYESAIPVPFFYQDCQVFFKPRETVFCHSAEKLRFALMLLIKPPLTVGKGNFPRDTGARENCRTLHGATGKKMGGKNVVSGGSYSAGIDSFDRFQNPLMPER